MFEGFLFMSLNVEEVFLLDNIVKKLGVVY